MQAYQTLVEALVDLRRRGYVYDFNQKQQGLHCENTGAWLLPDEFRITEFYRFYGKTAAGAVSLLCAVESVNGLKGIMVNRLPVVVD